MTPEQEVIFKLQSYFIENDIYKNYGKLDGVLFDLNSIKENYNKNRQFLVENYNYSSQQINDILKSRIPYLGKVVSFEKLISKKLPDQTVILYKTISLYAHPYDYRLYESDLIHYIIITVFDILDAIYKDIKPSSIGLEEEYNRVIEYNDFGRFTREIAHKQRSKLKELSKMLEELGYNFLSSTINTCRSIINDYLVDIAFGYTEQSTTK